MIRFILVLAIICAFNTSCNKKSRECFSFDRTENSSNKLKLNGYYYNRMENEYLVFFLYQNGIYFGGYSHISSNLSELDSTLEVNTYLYDLPYSWGIYKIINNKIVIEKWESGTGGPYPVYRLEGEIINDSTIFFEEELYDTIQFHHFSPKPDSITEFID